MYLHPTIYVNGYGATHDLDDPNYHRYLGELIRLLRIQDHDEQITVYLCGGHTNRTDLTEARCMLNIIGRLGKPYGVDFVLIEESITTRDNLAEVYKRVGRIPLTVFCESTRRPTVRYLAKRLFPEVQMMPVTFDGRSLSLVNRLKQRYLKLPLEVASVHSPAFDILRSYLHERHLAKCRAQTQKP